MARFLLVRGVTMKTMKKLKAELLANPAVRQAYDAQAPEFELARELSSAMREVSMLLDQDPSPDSPASWTAQSAKRPLNGRAAAHGHDDLT
jgi:hypothetical protein